MTATTQDPVGRLRRRRDRSHRVARVIATVVAVALLLPVAAAAEPPAGTPQLGPPRVDAEVDPQVRVAERRAVRRHAVTADGTARSSVTDHDDQALRSSRSGGLADVYFDYCGDARPNRLDLRKLRVLDGFDATLGFEFTLCAPTTATQLRGRFLDAVLLTDAGRRFRVSVTADAGGDPVGTVYDLDRRRLVGTRSAGRSQNGYVLRGSFPVGWLGNPRRFGLRAASVDRDGRTLDRLPELDEEPLWWPDSCTFEPFLHRTVTAEPGQLGRALASAREAGLTPTGVDADAGRFGVRLAEPRGAVALAALPGVAAEEPATLYQRGQVTAASGTGSNAWWRTQVVATSRADRHAAGTSIAVIDDGIDGARPEFTGRVGRGYDVVRGRSIASGGRSDRGGHGTAVAGVAAADSSAVRGIARMASLRPYNVFDAAGCASNTEVTAAINRAVNDGVDVINLSLGSDGVRTQDVPGLSDALYRARNAGIVVVAASGNSGQVGPSAPGDHPATIAVGATTPTKTVARYSNGGAWLELVAPGGTGQDSATASIHTLGERGGYVNVAGTSFAAPIVAGAAARSVAASDVDAVTFRSLATSTAEDLPPLGRDPLSGYGLVRIDRILVDAPDGRPRPRSTDPACAAAPPAPFTDVAGNTHLAGIGCIAYWRVTGGYGDGTYRPNGKVTRGQMATFVANVILNSGGTLPSPWPHFSDTRNTTHERAIRRLAAAGVVGGYADGSYRPGAPVTRGQMASFLVGAVQYRTGATLQRRAVGFHDTRKLTHEARIEQAATAGLASGVGGGYYAPQRHVTRAQMGSFLSATLAYLVDEAGATPPG